MPQVIPMGGKVRTLLVAWWGISIVTASPPAMPQEIPKGEVGIMTRVGGLVGFQSSGGSITSSYATGRSRWGGGDF